MIISNHLIGKMPIPKDAVVRINLAWVKTFGEADQIISESDHDIYLDYPDGRSKPPIPTLTLPEALRLADRHSSKVKYFAISNAEDLDKLYLIKRELEFAELVPKIETVTGVERMPQMIKMGIKTFMLDKEDIFTNVLGSSKAYEESLKRVRSYNKKVKILELQGVCFE